MAADYTVTSQKQSTQVSPGGTFQDVMIVTFTTTGTNVTGSVSVPLSQYNAAHVKALIEARVAEINAVHAI